ncbi:hypothetical protein FJT64_018873 [Amphibalanus amphitrite]|uniref:SWIM-type domain-containing protein n=1 Tax=Amphibalanus amphitrite TaxID=1232801 RepID=A0A6A4WVM5_AMPAM|nr:hypothetical protein FJT64_018873 [Amphibalanus amphitrite]
MEHSFFQQDHFQVIWKADAKYILCEKLDMIPDLEPELMEGTTVAYRCPASKESALQWIQLYQEAANITLTTNRSTDPCAAYELRVTCNKKPHNHAVDNAAALRHRRVSELTKARLMELFQHHHSPSTALETLKLQLQEEHGSAYPSVAADRAIVPDRMAVYYLYYKHCRERYPASTQEETMDLIRHMKDVRTAVSVEDGETVIAAVTPLMERVHTLPDAGEVVFVDASGGMDRHGQRVFLLMCWSPAGGLPLGVIVSTSETEAVVDKAFRLLVGILPDVKLCIFFQHRQAIMALAKQLVYANNEAEIATTMELVATEWGERYPLLDQYLQGFAARRQEWALCLRTDVPTRGHNTNNIVESAFRVLKDSVLYRTRAFNLLQLFDFVTVQLSKHYARRACDVANGRQRAAPVRGGTSQETGTVTQVFCMTRELIEVTEFTYQVKSLTSVGITYLVDLNVGACTCRMNRRTGGCKHLRAVRQQTGAVPEATATKETRRALMDIAMGTSQQLPGNWFDPLVAEPSTSSPPVPTPASAPGVAQPQPSPSPEEYDDDAMDFEDPAAAAAAVSGAEQRRSDDRTRQTVAFIQEWAAFMCEAVVQDDTWERAAAAFQQRWGQLPTAGRQSALHQFGGAQGCRRNATQIPVQPTSTARRTSTNVRGRARWPAGRPCRSARTGEHGYVAASARRSAAPHSLATCVDQNRPLGR